MSNQQQALESRAQERVSDWPRDFDVRAEFAEQQELLTSKENLPRGDVRDE